MSSPHGFVPAGTRVEETAYVLASVVIEIATYFGAPVKVSLQLGSPSSMQ